MDALLYRCSLSRPLGRVRILDSVGHLFSFFSLVGRLAMPLITEEAKSSPLFLCPDIHALIRELIERIKLTLKMSDNNDVLAMFGLSKRQLSILFGLECYIAFTDAAMKEAFLDKLNPFKGKHELKSVWCHNFRWELYPYLSSTDPKNQYNQISVEPQVLKDLIREESIQNPSNDIWKYLILLECSLFQPYYALSEEDAKSEKYKGLAIDEKNREVALKRVASILGLDYDLVKKYRTAYNKKIKKLSGYTKNIMIGALAGAIVMALCCIPFIGQIGLLFSAPGLFGIAAINSGLAALGGGAIAAGGFGIMGGIIVLPNFRPAERGFKSKISRQCEPDSSLG